ncbi:MAG: ATP-binding cassette domain-containing protein [Acidimicrobiales bacterium]
MQAQELELVEGRLYGADATDEILLGRRAASDLQAGIGSTVKIGDGTFRVVGIYASDVLWEDAGAFAPLDAVQQVAKKPDSLTVVYVDLAPGATQTDVADAIATLVPTVVVISGAADYGQVDQGFALIDAANVAISFLAIVIGGIGVMNTMIMSVFERTREIGVLRAVGWKGARALRMVLVESLVLCVVAAFVGSLIGVGITRLVLLSPTVSGFIQLAYPPGVFVQAFVVAIVAACSVPCTPPCGRLGSPPWRRCAMSDEPTRGDEPMVHLQGLVKTFEDGRLRAVDGVDLDVAPGEFVAIVGPSGCGKSTLLNLMAALDRPDEGTIVIGGHDLRQRRDLNHYRAEDVGLVFQLDNLLPSLTALENVEVPMFGQVPSRTERAARARQLLAFVGISDRADTRPPQLSGGERQRVAIARALANHPPLILADEPTGRLDSHTSVAVMDLLEGLQDDQGVTLIVVTHDPTVARRADRIVEMLDGRIASTTAASRTP